MAPGGGVLDALSEGDGLGDDVPPDGCEDEDDLSDDAIDDDDEGGVVDGLDGVDCDMLDDEGGVVVLDVVVWRSLQAPTSNAAAIATDNRERFIASPFVMNKKDEGHTIERTPATSSPYAPPSTSHHRNHPERRVGNCRRRRTICNTVLTAMPDCL